MNYAIYTHYVEGGDELARRFANEHLDYLATWEHRLIASGGLIDEDGRLVGGCIIAAADTLEEVHGRADRTPFSPLPPLADSVDGSAGSA